jgi:hypothetical protein
VGVVEFKAFHFHPAELLTRMTEETFGRFSVIRNHTGSQPGRAAAARDGIPSEGNTPLLMIPAP